MRNLKKVLALTLSLVMALSMVTIASAYEATPGTNYTDDAAIVEFDEAIQVLTQLNILQGRDEASGGGLDPNTPINRAEAATLIYRAVTGDTDGSDLPMFADDALGDVTVDDWFSGAVNYCVNNGIIGGREEGGFDPYAQVTGYEAMAMMLRAMGYDNGNRFSGATWQSETARYASLTGIHTDFNAAALRLPASRAVVAEIIFRSIAQTTTVTSNGLGDNQPLNVTIGYEVFGLYGDPRLTMMDNGEGNPDVLGHIGMNTKNPLTGAGRYETDDLALMTNRLDARPDLAVEGYGAPVAIWYLDGANRDGAGVPAAASNPVARDRGAQIRQNNTAITGDHETEIHVLFTPVAAYTTAVTVGDLRADAIAAGAPIDETLPNENVTTYRIIDDAAADTGAGTSEVDSVVIDTLHVDGIATAFSTSTTSLTDNNALTTASAGITINAASTISAFGVGERDIHHVYGTGKGVHTDLYYEDGRLFMTIKNVYSAQVATAWNTTTGTDLNIMLTDASGAGGAASLTGKIEATLASLLLTARSGVYDEDGLTADLARGDIVTFSVKNALSEYGDYRTVMGNDPTDTAKQVIDVEDIKKADVNTVEVTNSYINANEWAQYSTDTTAGNWSTALGNTEVDGNEDTEVSWFIAGGRTWEYNKQYGRTIEESNTDIQGKYTGSKSSANQPAATGQGGAFQPVLSKDNSNLYDWLLDREELLSVNQVKQNVYTDECGYVVYTEEATDTLYSGYIALQYGAYANRGYDNLYYVTYTGINHNGDTVSLTGGYKQSYFLTQKEATDAAAAEIGLYWYQQEITGNYILETVGSAYGSGTGQAYDDVAAAVGGLIESELNNGINNSDPTNTVSNFVGLLYSGIKTDGSTVTTDYDGIDDHLASGVVVHYVDMNDYGVPGTDVWADDDNGKDDEDLRRIMAGDADALDDPATDTIVELVDDDTLFVIAEYDYLGRLTGYRVEEGYKNIPDMTDGEIETSQITSDPDKRVDYEVYYTTTAGDVEGTTIAEDRTIDMVLVLGAKCTDDPYGAATGDDMFYLLDITPDELVDQYDTHTVLVKGETAPMRTVKHLVQETLANEGMANTTGLYQVVRRANGLVAGVTPINDLPRIMYVAEGVLWTIRGDTDWDNIDAATGNVTAYGAIAADAYDWNAKGTQIDYAGGPVDEGYIPYADDCAFYWISGGTVSEISATSSRLGGTNMGYVAATDEYGFATVVYVVAPVSAYPDS